MPEAEARPSPRQLAHQLSLSLRWAWEAAPATVVLLSFSQLVMALLPAAMAWVGRTIIDGVVKAAASGSEEDRKRALAAMSRPASRATA